MEKELVTSPSGGTGRMIMEVSSGKLIDLSDFKVEDVDLIDIANSLSKQCRFCGHCDRFYSVAEHAVRVCRAVMGHYFEDQKEKIEMAAWGLHHDDSEAYLGDVIRPLKTDDYKETEDLIMAIIAEKLGLQGLKVPDIVKHYDNVLVSTEGLYIMKNETKNWPRREEMADSLPPENFQDVGWPPGHARTAFLQTSKWIEESLSSVRSKK